MLRPGSFRAPQGLAIPDREGVYPGDETHGHRRLHKLKAVSPQDTRLIAVFLL